MSLININKCGCPHCLGHDLPQKTVTPAQLEALVAEWEKQMATEDGIRKVIEEYKHYVPPPINGYIPRGSR